jgi:hypothetical protein
MLAIQHVAPDGVSNVSAHHFGRAGQLGGLTGMQSSAPPTAGPERGKITDRPAPAKERA